MVGCTCTVQRYQPYVAWNDPRESGVHVEPPLSERKVPSVPPLPPAASQARTKIANRRDGWLGAIAIAMRPMLAVGSPPESFTHVAPPSVVL